MLKSILKTTLYSLLTFVLLNCTTFIFAQVEGIEQPVFNLRTANNNIEEVWTDMRPVFNIMPAANNSLVITYPGNSINNNSKHLACMLPQGSSMHHIVSDGWSMTYKINGDEGFSVSPLFDGGIRLSFPVGSDIDIRPGQLNAKPFRKSCERWIMEFIPQRNGSVRVNMQPKP